MENSKSKNDQNIIPYVDFVDGKLNSLSWYDYLPGDNVLITGDGDHRSAAEIGDYLLTLDKIEDYELIDLLAVKILNSCPSINTCLHWSKLAYRLSKLMSDNLTAKGNRSIRMRAQRLIYYLQSLIDDRKNNDYEDLIVSETTLEGSKPWDYVCNSSGEWWLTSDDENIHYRTNDGVETHWAIGLPTQIDLLSGGKLAIGSIYSDGATILNGEDCEFIKHSSPVLLVFEYKEQQYFLDHQGCIWDDETRSLFMEIDNTQIHFARYFNGVVYLLDNGDFGHITLAVLGNKKSERFSVLPVQVCNDIVVTETEYYLIDKQQGSVFKFNTSWEYESRALLFGRTKGCLHDPVTLRIYNDHLYVVSWLSARLTKLKLF